MKTFIIAITLLFTLSATAQTNEITTVYFSFNKHDLEANAVDELNHFMAKTKTIPGKIELYGHCDFKGNDRYNDALSVRRVESVKNFLVNAGISPGDIIITKGYGKRNPLNGNATAEEQQLNRRVEIKWIVNNTEKTETSLKEKIADSTVTAGTNITLRNINFAGGLPHFLPESTPALEELLDAMQTFPKLVIEIQGHICCQSDTREGLNMETGYYTLSADRAKAIKDYLIAKGINATRVAARGFGHSAPLYPYPEKSEAERIANRRVEIKIISK